MRTRTIPTLALLAGLLAVTALGASATPPPTADRPADETEASETPACSLVEDAAPVPAANGWTFEGCFTWFPAGPCRDVFRDSNGVLWICGACGTTNNPGPGKCSKLTGSGWWCS